MTTPINVKIAQDFLAFNQASASEYHCTAEAVSLLKSAGFEQLCEKSKWDIKPNGKYYVVRDQASVIAFAVGGQYTPESPMIGTFAHVDSPCLKLKPISKQTNAEMLQVGIQTYGGLLTHTWFDRDLSVAGRVFVNRGGKITSELLCIKDPILRIPNLAIHLDRTVSTDGFKPNTETSTVPILASALADLGFEQVGKTDDADVFRYPADGAKAAPTCGKAACGATPAEKLAATFSVKHHSAFLQRIAIELKCETKEIVDFELNIYDTQPPALNGLYKEFVVGRGLDNQLMSFICTRSMIDAVEAGLENQQSLMLVGLFNHEEIGSMSTTGADGNFLVSVLNRINPTALAQSSARSLWVSADMAHALHPNYSAKHEVNHRPMMQKGLVVKVNANQRYASCLSSNAPLMLCAAEHDIPLQDFVVRNDVGCGSTIGAMMSAKTGIKTVDVGVPQWSMHSVRETAGVLDVQSSHKLLTQLYKQYAEYEEQFDCSL